MNTSRNKLSLKTETLVRLDSSELAEVNGGTWTLAVRASIAACRHSKKIGHGVVAAGKAVDWAIKHRPKGDPTNPPSFVGATA